MYKFTHFSAVAILVFSSNLFAQGIAEDFSSNPLILEVREDNLGTDEDGVSIGPDGASLLLRASTDNDERGKIQISPFRADEIAELSVTASVSSETKFDPLVEGKVSINMEAYLYNDIQERGLGDDERTGDSRVSMSMVHQENGTSYAVVCFDRRNTDGSKSVQPGADVNNGDKCTSFAALPQFDTMYTMSIGYDRTSAVVYGMFDGERVEFPVTTGHFTVQRPYSEFVLRVEGTSSVGVAVVQSASSNVFELNDFNAYSEPQNYRFPNSDQDVEISDGRLRMAVANDEDSRKTNRGFPVVTGETNYVEATMMLSSESVLTSEGYNTARLRNTFYNEVQDGGIGDDGLGTATSNVFAAINLFMAEDRSVAADVSIFRADNGNWSELSILSNDPEDPYPLLMEGLALDTEYLASIRLDKEASQIVLNFEGVEHIFNIQTPIYQSSFTSGAGVDVRVNGAGETVAYFDNFRTDPDVLTNEELTDIITEESSSESTTNDSTVDESFYEGIACIDNDGDGWGWQQPDSAPGRSCLVAVLAEEDAYEGVPCIDSDGDGWGWQQPEGAPGRSCQLADIDSMTDENVYEGVDCVDSDGDGWGWQEPAQFPGRSCIVE